MTFAVPVDAAIQQFVNYDTGMRVSVSLIEYEQADRARLFDRWLESIDCESWNEGAVDLTYKILPDSHLELAPGLSAVAEELELRPVDQPDVAPLSAHRVVFAGPDFLGVIMVSGSDGAAVSQMAESLTPIAADRYVNPSDPAWDLDKASWSRWFGAAWKGAERQIADIDFNVSLDEYAIAFDAMADILDMRMEFAQRHPLPPDVADEIVRLLELLDDYSENAKAISSAAATGDRPAIDALIAERAPIIEARDELLIDLGITAAP